MAASQLFYGALSDALGRRRVILPALLLYALGSAMFFSHSAAYMAASPILYEKQLGLSPERYGLVIMFTAVFYLAGNLLNTVLLKKHDEEDLVKAGLWLSLFGALLMLVLSLMGPITLWAVAVRWVVAGSTADAAAAG
jgi:DHA1 family bicyclomycin/chloramphenicol resistance-like MFS transporter